MADRGATWLGLQRRSWPVVRAGALLGLGLGAFFDGIVFHQVLQWHHMLSSHPDSAVAGDLPLNVLADGLFHAAAYVFTVAGVAALWRARRRRAAPVSGRVLVGAVVLGWGVFNVVEGLVNHQVLGVHHVWADGPGGVLLWDAAFLAWGALFVLGGYAVARSDASRDPEH
jgi:uncharacterized membrane protein